MSKMGRFGVVTVITAFTAGFWQGYTLLKMDSASVKQVSPVIDPQIRLEHAKELFGKHYSSSVVRRAEYAAGIESYIFDQVSRGLPSVWKDSARSVTDAIIGEANKSGLDPLFVLAVITRESRLKPEARGRHGEIGLMQLRPCTAEWIAKKTGIEWHGEESLLDPVENIRLGVTYIGHLRKRFDRHSLFYISAYNMGPGKLNQLVKQNVEPREYAGHVMNHYIAFYREIVRLQAQRLQGSVQYRVVANF